MKGSNNGAVTMAGKARQRASARERAKLFNKGLDLRCHCADCETRRGAPRQRTEQWERIEREQELRRLARKANSTWRL